tara:strand:+ start:2349 stop:2495 length:147 start_codon:yes stop_codon:yes gene_type:complete
MFAPRWCERLTRTRSGFKAIIKKYKSVLFECLLLSYEKSVSAQARRLR